MASDNSSGRVAEKGPITRSSREALSKKLVASGSAILNRKSERLEKQTPPWLAVKMDHKRKTTTRSPLRRYERTRKASPSDLSDPSASKSMSSGSKKHCTEKPLVFEASGDNDHDDEGEEGGAEASSRLRPKKMTANDYLALFVKPSRVDFSGCHEKTNGMHKSTEEGDYHQKTNGNDTPTQEECRGRTNGIYMPTQEDCHEKTSGNDRPTQVPDCHEKSNGVDRLTQEGDDDVGGGKIDGCLKGNYVDSAKDDKVVQRSEDASGKEMTTEPKLSGPVKGLLEDKLTVNSLEQTNASCEPSGAHGSFKSDSGKEETSLMLGSRDSVSNENLIRKCIDHDKGEKSIFSKRKRTMMNMHSDASAMLGDNDNSSLIEDARPSRMCGNVVETSESCSKRIRRISLSDVKRDWGKNTNNVDQPSSKSNGEKVSSRNKEAFDVSCGRLTPAGTFCRRFWRSCDSERPQGNTVETEKIRKQQRSLHLLLKPEIANLCEILCLPDTVKSMVEKCLEYTMNNYQICTEPMSILQAFQLSLCWTTASLLNHKLDFEASLALAKQHLNFGCKKEVVDEINSRLLGLKDSFLSLTGNSNVTHTTYQKASESSNGVYSCTEVTPEVELVKIDNSKNIKVVQKRKSQWKKLLLMQKEEKEKLKKDIENETIDFRRRYHIELAAIRSFSPNDGMKEEILKVFRSEYMKRMRELERQHEIRLKDLEAKQLETRLMFQESMAQDELLNPVASDGLGTKVDSLQICDQAQHHNAPIAPVSYQVAQVKGFNDIVEVMKTAGTGMGLSEELDANASAAVPCRSTVELQTPLVKQADADELDIAASKDGPVSRNKCNNIAEIEYDSQGNIISMHSKSKEQCSDGDVSTLDKGEGCVNFSHEFHNDFGKDAITRDPPSSNEEICDGETLDVSSGEVTPTVCNANCSNDDRVEIPSRQWKLDGTILSMPVCGSSIEVEANGSNDGAKNIAPLNSQSSEERVSTVSPPNCENAAQIQQAGDNYGSNNDETLNSFLADERVSSNSKPPRDHVHNENATCMLNYENIPETDDGDDRNGSNNFIMNSPLIDERNADSAIIFNRDAHVGMLETVNITPTEHISGGSVDVSVLDSVLSRPCGADSPNICSDANAIILSNQLSLEKQNNEGVSSSIPTGQIPVEASHTCHERVIINVLGREEAMDRPGTVNCTSYTENLIPLNSSSIDEISNGAPVLDSDLSSGHSTTSPSNGDEQIPVLVPENSHEEAECLLIDSMVVDKNATLDEQEGVCRIVSDNSLSQVTPVSRPVGLIEPIEQGQSLSSVESPPDQDNVREMQNTLVSSPVDIPPANQSIHDSPVMDPILQDEQLPSVGFLSSNQDLYNMPLVTGTEDQPSNEDDLPNLIPETSVEIQNQVVMQHASNLDQQEGVCRTMTENSLSQETPVSISVDLMEPLEQVQPSPDQETARELRNTSVSSSVDVVPAIQTINDSLVMEPPQQEEQLTSGGVLSSNQDPSNLPLLTGTEDQPSNEDDLPYHIPEISIEIQNQAVVQCASNVEHDSHTCFRQVVHPASDMDLDSLLPGGVRLQSSGTRNLSTLTETNNHLIQPANQSASRIIQHLCYDPLSNELERLRRLIEQNMKDRENKKLQLKCDFEKELEELYRKYDVKRKEVEVEYQNIRKTLDTQRNIVLVNKMLAEAFRAKFMDLKVTSGSRMQEVASSAQQLMQIPSQQNATRPSVVACPSSVGPPAASLQSSYATATSQTLVPPMQGSFSSVSPRLPHINSLSSPLGNVQTGGGEIRAPPPHLQHCRPPTSVPASSFFTVPHGRPSHPAPGNNPVTSSPFSRRIPRPITPAFHSVPYRRHWPVSTGGPSTPNLSAMNSHAGASAINMPNVRPHMPDLASLNLSKCGTSSSTLANPATSPDVVCLSDDE